MEERVKTKPNKTPRKKGQLARDIISDVFSLLVVVLSVIIVVLSLSSKNTYGVPVVNGKSYLYVQTDSMTGTINKGDLIVVDNVQFSYNYDDNRYEPSIELVENESIISFLYDIDSDGDSEIVTHKVIGINDQGTVYTTQGTYKKEESDVLAVQYVNYKNIIGVYNGKRIPVLGSIYSFMMDTPYAWGFAVVVICPMFIFFLFKLYKLILTIVETKEINNKERAKELAAISEEEKARQKEIMRQEILKELGMEDKTDK